MESIDRGDNLLADYGYENRRFVMYPLHLVHEGKKYWALLVLRNKVKTWDSKADISAYYLSSLFDIEPPKDLLNKVLWHIIENVQRKLDQKEIKGSQRTFPFGKQYIPLPLGNLKLEIVDVHKTPISQETGFLLLSWIVSAKNKTFLDQLSRPAGYRRDYSADLAVKKFSVEVRKELGKHLGSPMLLPSEKRQTRSSQKFETPSQPKPNTVLARKANQNPKMGNKVL